jgi:hypothetical protein
MKSLFYQNIQDNKLLKEIKAHNVLLERVQLYHEFIVNLTYYLYDTYLGAESIVTSQDMEGHFNWGYNKVIKEFKEEGIDFSTNADVKEFFAKYFVANLYNGSPANVDSVLTQWKEIFTLRPEKSETEFQLLLEIYERFDTTFGI